MQFHFPAVRSERFTVSPSKLPDEAINGVKYFPEK
jgi:hypothetical protein